MRAATHESPIDTFSPDVKNYVSQSQLALIGAIILAFNELEATFDRFFFIIAGLSSKLSWEVSARVGGLESKISIIKIGAAEHLNSKEMKALEDLLGNSWYGNVKTVRDCLAHVRHLNIHTNVGKMFKVSRGLRIFNVLTSVEALEKSYNLLVTINREINSTALLVSKVKHLKEISDGDLKKEQYEREANDCRVLIDQFRTFRLALPAIPPCPSEPELRVLEDQLRQAHLAMSMGWVQSNQAWQVPNFLRRNPALYSPGVTWTPPPLPLLEEEKSKKK